MCAYDKNIHTLATVALTETPEGLHINSITSLFLHGLFSITWDPRACPPVTLIENFPSGGNQGNRMKQKTQSSTKDKSMSSQPDFWRTLLLEKCHFRVVKSFSSTSNSPDLTSLLHFFVHTVLSVGNTLLCLINLLTSYLFVDLIHTKPVCVLSHVQHPFTECLTLPAGGIMFLSTFSKEIPVPVSVTCE